MKYYISKSINAGFDEAVERITASLGKEGFGVLTTIDLDEKLKAKLNVDFRRYRILGACNPAFAWKALQEEDKIGTMLPCSVIVQEAGEGMVEVAAVDPVASMMAVGNPHLEELAGEVREMLTRAVNSL